VRTYEKRLGDVVVERVQNIRPGTRRAEELDRWVADRDGYGGGFGWFLAGDDEDDGSAAEASVLAGDKSGVPELLAETERASAAEQRAQLERIADEVLDEVLAEQAAAAAGVAPAGPLPTEPPAGPPAGKPRKTRE